MRPAVALVLLVAACAQAAVLQTVDEKKPDFRKIPQRHLPYAGTGTCGEPVTDPQTGHVTVSCLGAKHLLSPGQTIDTMMTLANPYPKDQLVLILNQTSQIVDDTMRPVPLSELYLHHWGGPATFVQGSGAEIHTSYIRKRLPAPYGTVVNGSAYVPPYTRMANIQLINTLGLPKEEAKACLECWCDHDPWHPKGTIDNSLAAGAHPHHDKGDPTRNRTEPAQLAGSLLCCHQCPSENPFQEPIGYHMQYNITYRPVQPDEHIVPTGGLIYDVVGGPFEYQLPHPDGGIHTKTYDTTIDQGCRQDAPFEILRCTGHQHFGGQCLSLYNLDADEPICNTCPEFGTEPGVVGNEEGYVTLIPDDNLSPPYKVNPGTRIRIESKYDYSVPRFGVMGLMFTTNAGLTRKCSPFGGNNNGNAAGVNEDLGSYGMHTTHMMGGYMDEGLVLSMA